jgi:predicted DNA-binding transcriptional regulator YafY
MAEDRSQSKSARIRNLSEVQSPGIVTRTSRCRTPKALKRSPSGTRTSFESDPFSDYSDRSELIDRLMVAIEDHFVSLITYQSDQASESSTVEIYPQGFIFHRASLYLIAWSVPRNALRTYKMDRIESVEATKLSAVVPEDFDLADWLEHTFGIFRSGGTELQTIRIHFTREVARYVRESKWQKHQQLQPQDNGSLIVEFRLTDTQELKRWIMSFGPKAVVLEPKELVEEIQRDLEQTLSNYVMEQQSQRGPLAVFVGRSIRLTTFI